MELGHALVIFQSLILISVLTGRRSCSRDCWERALPVRSMGGLCCATVILYSVAPRLGAASPQLSFSRPAPQSSSVSHGRRVRSPVLPPWRAIASRPSSNGDWRSRRAACRLVSIRFPSRCFPQSPPVFTCRLVLATYRDRLGVLRRSAGDVASLLRRRLTGSTLLRRVAHKLVQGDLRPIVKAHRDDRRPSPD